MKKKVSWDKILVEVVEKEDAYQSVKTLLSDISVIGLSALFEKRVIIISGVPASFRRYIVQLLEKSCEKSFYFWDDSHSPVESLEAVQKWLLGGEGSILKLSVGGGTTYSDLENHINKSEGLYNLVPIVSEEGEYSVKGDSFEIFPVGAKKPVRIEFFGEKIDEIKEIDLLTRMPTREFRKYYLTLSDSGKNLPLSEREKNERRLHLKSLKVSSGNYDLIRSQLVVFVDPGFVVQDHVDLPYEEFHFRLSNIAGSVDLDTFDYIVGLSKKISEVNIVTAEVARVEESLSKGRLKNVNVSWGNLEKGVYFEDRDVVFVSDNELFGTLHTDIVEAKVSDNLEAFLEDIRPGDYVVHEDHGIGVFSQILEKEVENEHSVVEKKEYILLEYLDNDQLMIPVEQKSRIIKYVGVDGARPTLTRLDGRNWKKTKTTIQKRVEKIAKEIVKLYAKRSQSKGFVYKKDSKRAEELADSFPFDLTADQEKAYEEIVTDMESKKLLDRLLVGDVGFGKTEIALRVAFKAVESGKQVVILAPTTVLVQQHFEVFQNRLKNYGIKVASVSGMVSSKDNKKTLERLGAGDVDIIIGTHRLLSKDVDFYDLGLLIVDEEQRFGVKQKEKIKAIKSDLDVLSMSATPIPRTLQMSLSGLRDISVIQTPPPGRIPIKTELVKFSFMKLAEYVSNELDRNGQVFVVHNNVRTIDSFAAKLSELVPTAKVSIGHGQMDRRNLAQIMNEFKAGKKNVLVATTIVENGLDLPNVNTIVIDGAENFGLAELYQLRGRVGRGDRQAFCYLMYKGKTRDFEDLVFERNSEYRRELIRKIDTIESNESSVREGDSKFGAAFSSVLDKHRESGKNVKAGKRLKAILDSSELASGFSLAAKDLEIRGAGNILGREQHGFVSKIGLGMYMKILAQAVALNREILQSKNTK